MADAPNEAPARPSGVRMGAERAAWLALARCAYVTDDPRWPGAATACMPKGRE
jgi:hypothetical protein